MTLYIHGGQVLPGGPTTLEQADVLIENDRLTAVGIRH